MGRVLSIGIVGLPNVGKSTLFNALLKKSIANTSNYPFCTIKPNVGIVKVPDKRLPILAEVIQTKRIVPAVIEFYDIAGLVKGASKGEGLGNKFLSHIGEVSAIAHVVRLFEDKSISHVSKIINPVEDIKTIETELILADLAVLEKIKEANKNNATKQEVFAFNTISIIKEKLNKGIPVRKIALTNEQKESIKQFNLLTLKPVVYIFNLSEKQLESAEQTKKNIKDTLKQVGEENAPYIYLSALLENEIFVFENNEQKEYLKQYSLKETGLNRFIKKAYDMLELISFFTAVPTAKLEAKAWTIKKGSSAYKAAGIVHTDFQKKFIKADVISFPEFIKYNGWLSSREKGKVQTVGKNYVIKDSDVIEFKVQA